MWGRCRHCRSSSSCTDVAHGHSIVCWLPFAQYSPISLPSTLLVSFTILTQGSRHKFTRCHVQPLSTLMSHTPLHQSFRDLHRTVECLLVILRHDDATVEPPATLRSRIRPREVNTLPKDTDVFTIDIVRRHLLRGQFPKDVFQLFD